MSSLAGDTLEEIRAIADFQFRHGAGKALFPKGVDFIRGKGGRVRQVILGGKRLASLRAGDGLFTLAFAGGLRLHAVFTQPAFRVVVNADAAPFVSAGKTAFARHVVAADRGISPRDEVLVTGEGDDLLAVGRALLSPLEMLDFESGAAIDVREGREAHGP